MIKPNFDEPKNEKTRQFAYCSLILREKHEAYKLEGDYLLLKSGSKLMKKN